MTDQEKQALSQIRTFIEALQPSTATSLFFHPECLEIANLIFKEANSVPKKNILNRFFSGIQEKFCYPKIPHSQLITQKVLFLTAIRDFIAQGGMQVVSFNSGYCPLLCTEARNFPDVNFFELNIEPIRSTKMKALDQWMNKQKELRQNIYLGNQIILSESQLRDCFLVKILPDLFKIGDNCIFLNWTNQELAEILLPQGFNPEQKTLVLFDGVSSLSNKEAPLPLLRLFSLLSEESPVLLSFETDKIEEVHAFALKHQYHIAEKMLYQSLPASLQNASLNQTEQNYYCFKKGLIAEQEEIPDMRLYFPKIISAEQEEIPDMLCPGIISPQFKE